jgi:hypothetical protein
MTSSTKLVFPHDPPTPITGKPVNTTLQILQRQLFANARAIRSPRGGGTNGHLALLLDDATYFARAGVAFVLPIHPGPSPVHTANATAAQIAETIRIYQQELSDIDLYSRVTTALQSQILGAVDNTYLRALEDPDFGFADVTPRQMLEHLRALYGILTPEELERNRASLSLPWNPEAPLEELWSKIDDARRIATAGGAPINDVTVITLTLAMFEKSGLLSHTTQMFRLRPIGEWTMDIFKAEFQLGNQERIRQLTAGAAGYHGAHSATPVLSLVPAMAAASLSIPPAAPFLANVQGVKLYYCWSHGLGTNSSHTSATCARKATGHIDNATVMTMQGGNDKINLSNPRRRSSSTNN